MLGLHSGSKKRDNNTEINRRKRFCKSLETLFDLTAKNAEQHIPGDHLRTENAQKENVFCFFCVIKETLAKCKCPFWIINQEKNDKENVKESTLKISK